MGAQRSSCSILHRISQSKTDRTPSCLRPPPAPAPPALALHSCCKASLDKTMRLPSRLVLALLLCHALPAVFGELIFATAARYFVPQSHKRVRACCFHACQRHVVQCTGMPGMLPSLHFRCMRCHNRTPVPCRRPPPSVWLQQAVCIGTRACCGTGRAPPGSAHQRPHEQSHHRWLGR